MSRESTVTVRFKPNESALDPDDPMDTACARTELGGGFSQALRDEQAEALSETRLMIALGASLNGGRARVSSTIGRGLVGKVSAQVKAVFDDEPTSEIPFRAGEHCRRYIQGVCWHPNPLQWPAVIPAGLDQGQIILEDDGNGNPVITEDITIELPENPGAWISPQSYLCSITRAPSYPSDKTPPAVLCEGALYTSDTEDNPFLADNPGIIATGNHCTRFDYRYYLVNIDNYSNDITVSEGTTAVSGAGGVANFDVLQNSLSTLDINRAITAAQSDPQLGGDPMADQYELYLAISALYGRVHFSAFGQCQKPTQDCEDADCGPYPARTHPCCERIFADQASAFQRPKTEIGTVETLVCSLEPIGIWDVEIWVYRNMGDPNDGTAIERDLFESSNLEKLAYYGLSFNGKEALFNGASCSEPAVSSIILRKSAHFSRSIKLRRAWDISGRMDVEAWVGENLYSYLFAYGPWFPNSSDLDEHYDLTIPSGNHRHYVGFYTYTKEGSLSGMSAMVTWA